jgi:hypothetical protein
MRTFSLLVLLTACGGAPPPAGTVDRSQITAMTLVTESGQATYCPHGTPPHLIARLTTASGGELESGAPGERGIPEDAFTWTASWGSIDRGRLRLPYDPTGALERDVTVEAVLTDRPDLEATLVLAPDFGCGGVVGGVGDRGRDGERGQNGPPGFASTPEERGTDGEPGDDGEPGGRGDNGAPIEVAITKIESPRHGMLIAVVVMPRPEAQTMYLVDPDGAPFVISAGGGEGGHGGRGGDGGKRSQEFRTIGGAGGAGGRGGDGGNGSSMKVYVDPRWPELAGMVQLSTKGGAGGPGGEGGKGTDGGADGAPGVPGTPGEDGPAPDVRNQDVERWVKHLGLTGLWKPISD